MIKKILVQLNHPAHYHLFKNIIKGLEQGGVQVFITVKNKDILLDLLQDDEYQVLVNNYRKKNLYSILSNVLIRDKKLYDYVKKIKPDLMIGTSPEIGHITKLVNIPAIFFGEDDVNLSKTMYLAAFTCYPFFKKIVSPDGCNNGIWNKKTLRYSGYQKLAYLHPNQFIPDTSKVKTPKNRKYFILRFSDLNAYHDKNQSGITNQIAEKIIHKLKPKGDILISSERRLPEKLEKYRFQGNYQDIHHYLSFADLYIGDSQSMAVEAAILGTPGIRFNDFSGKISVLNELEYHYQLTRSIPSVKTNLLFETIDNFINDADIKRKFETRKTKMLNDKIDVTGFFTWYLKNFPESDNLMNENPKFQYNFR